jgi:hypothetical protein
MIHTKALTDLSPKRMNTSTKGRPLRDLKGLSLMASMIQNTFKKLQKHPTSMTMLIGTWVKKMRLRGSWDLKWSESIHKKNWRLDIRQDLIGVGKDLTPVARGTTLWCSFKSDKTLMKIWESVKIIICIWMILKSLRSSRSLMTTETSSGKPKTWDRGKAHNSHSILRFHRWDNYHSKEVCPMKETKTSIWSIRIQRKKLLIMKIY